LHTDLLGAVQLAPERSRKRILDLAATQFASGGAYHQYQPLTKTGNDTIGSGFNDDPLWLVLGVAAYLKETGDTTVLDERVPFSDAGDATLYGHLSTFGVEDGQVVKRGDMIGQVGSTGFSTGAHLHFEIRYLADNIDPCAEIKC